MQACSQHPALSRLPRLGGNRAIDRTAISAAIWTGFNRCRRRTGLPVTIGRRDSAVHRADGLAPQHDVQGAISAHDSAALADLYLNEAPRLAKSMARHRAYGDSEDLVQDAFVRLARLPRGLASLDVPRAYLRRIATNLVRNQARSDARHSRSLHLEATDETLPFFDPHRQLESRDMLRRVEAAIQRLPQRTREIFVAHRVEGLSYLEIAERTGLSVKGVEKQMSKALVRIDRILARS